MKFLILILLFPLGVQAQPAGPKCIDRVIDAIVGEMVCPCGQPVQDPTQESLEIYYLENAQGMSRHIPEEFCGFASPAGLGRFRVEYKSLSHGDCQIGKISEP